MLLDREPLALSCALISAAACGLPGVLSLEPEPLEGGVQKEAVATAAGLATRSGKAEGPPNFRYGMRRGTAC